MEEEITYQCLKFCAEGNRDVVFITPTIYDELETINRTLYPDCLLDAQAHLNQLSEIIASPAYRNLILTVIDKESTLWKITFI